MAQMPYVISDPEVSRLIGALYDRHVILAFDWSAWQDEVERFS